MAGKRGPAAYAFSSGLARSVEVEVVALAVSVANEYEVYYAPVSLLYEVNFLPAFCGPFPLEAVPVAPFCLFTFW